MLFSFTIISLLLVEMSTLLLTGSLPYTVLLITLSIMVSIELFVSAAAEIVE